MKHLQLENPDFQDMKVDLDVRCGDQNSDMVKLGLGIGFENQSTPNFVIFQIFFFSFRISRSS
jgi:hypothetical protein